MLAWRRYFQRLIPAANIAGLVLVMAACVASGPLTDVMRPLGHALQPAQQGLLKRLSEEVARRAGPGESGLLLLGHNAEALRWRLALIDSATRSLDLQYYLWKGDAAGALLARHILRAADRGVRVRVLIDDFLLTRDDADEEGFHQHPNIDIRTFNPWNRGSYANRPDTVRRAWEFIRRPELNHRMHNKVLIADNHVAIAGGRNVADEYFGLNEEQNFKDLDVLAIGPVVPDLAETFDDFWNDEWTHSIEMLAGERADSADLERLYRRVEKVLDGARDRLRDFALEPIAWNERLVGMVDRITYGSAEAVSDDPVALRDGVPDQVAKSIIEFGSGIESELTIISAYFVPRQDLVDYLSGLTDRGIRVRVLTNSLASNNHAIASSQYKKWRKPLLAAGVELYEMRSDRLDTSSIDTPPVAARTHVLHTKAVMMDQSRMYIGALNISPRGHQTNVFHVLVGRLNINLHEVEHRAFSAGKLVGMFIVVRLDVFVSGGVIGRFFVRDMSAMVIGDVAELNVNENVADMGFVGRKVLHRPVEIAAVSSRRLTVNILSGAYF